MEAVPLGFLSVDVPLNEDGVVDSGMYEPEPFNLNINTEHGIGVEELPVKFGESALIFTNHGLFDL